MMEIISLLIDPRIQSEWTNFGLAGRKWDRFQTSRMDIIGLIENMHKLYIGRKVSGKGSGMERIQLVPAIIFTCWFFISHVSAGSPGFGSIFLKYSGNKMWIEGKELDLLGFPNLIRGKDLIGPIWIWLPTWLWNQGWKMHSWSGARLKWSGWFRELFQLLRLVPVVRKERRSDYLCHTLWTVSSKIYPLQLTHHHNPVI